jgi:hypothetical protein
MHSPRPGPFLGSSSLYFPTLLTSEVDPATPEYAVAGKSLITSARVAASFAPFSPPFITALVGAAFFDTLVFIGEL